MILGWVGVGWRQGVGCVKTPTQSPLQPVSLRHSRCPHRATWTNSGPITPPLTFLHNQLNTNNRFGCRTNKQIFNTGRRTAIAEIGVAGVEIGASLVTARDSIGTTECQPMRLSIKNLFVPHSCNALAKYRRWKARIKDEIMSALASARYWPRSFSCSAENCLHKC